MSFIDRTLDSKLAWGVIILSSAALIAGGILGHSAIPIVAGSVELGTFVFLKIMQVSKRALTHSGDSKPGFTPTIKQVEELRGKVCTIGKSPINFNKPGCESSRGSLHFGKRTTFDSGRGNGSNYMTDKDL